MSRGVELVLDARASLGECPRWDAAAERLWWVDINAGAVRRLDPSSGRDETWDVGEKVGAVAPRAAGGAVLATASGFAALDPADGRVERLASVDTPDDVIMNDGACDPEGRFWAGTVAEDERPGAGAVYRLEPDGAVTTALTDVTISNGIAWSPDGTRMYYVDSATGGLDAFDFSLADGTLRDRTRLVDVPEADGLPDGIAVDHDGAIWVSLWGGASVRRYRPDGTLERSVELPVPHVTACGFGGRDGATLFVTTAAGYLEPGEREAYPHAGGLFAVEPGVTGPPARPFAG